MPNSVTATARQLATDRVPYVHAQVVRAQVPTSAHAGDEAIVREDGSIDGFVGGVCAEATVRTAALQALRDGDALLLRVLPSGERDFPDSPGAQVVVNPCLSGGALEIFLEPVLPPPLVAVVGYTPVAAALVEMAGQLGYETVRSGTAADTVEGLPEHPAAVIVASHGRSEEETIQAALDAGAGYVALVASPRRGTAVLDGLGLTEAERSRVSTPAGFDIGARTPGEVAVSILAEMISLLRRKEYTPVPPSAGPAADPPSGPVQTTDPVCGMTVTVMPDTPALTVDGDEIWFCGTGCRDSYREKAAQSSGAAR